MTVSLCVAEALKCVLASDEEHAGVRIPLPLAVRSLTFVSSESTRARQTNRSTPPLLVAPPASPPYLGEFFRPPFLHRLCLSTVRFAVTGEYCTGTDPAQRPKVDPEPCLSIFSGRMFHTNRYNARRGKRRKTSQANHVIRPGCLRATPLSFIAPLVRVHACSGPAWCSGINTDGPV